MNQSSNLFRSTRSSAAPYGAAIYTHPCDVTSDPKLTTAEKKAVLASWISDARAVENAPSLRRLDSGAVVEVDSILQALVLLDQQAPDCRENGRRLHLSGRSRSVISRWMKRVSPSKGSNAMMTTRRLPRRVSECRFVPNLCRRPMASVLKERGS